VRGETAASRRARQATRRELTRSLKRVRTLRFTYRALGVTFLLFLVLFASWWYRFAARGWEGTGVVLITQILTIMAAVDAAVMFLCARYLPRSPVIVGCLGAGLVTISAVLGLLMLSWDRSAILLQAVVLTRLALAAGLWAMLPAATRVKRLFEEHPDLAALTLEKVAQRRRSAGRPRGTPR